MILSFSDIELLNLVGWCKQVPTGIDCLFSSKLFTPSNLKILRELGAITYDKSKTYFRLSTTGYFILRQLGYEYQEGEKPRYDMNTIRRRNISALSFITFYRSGIHVFSEGVDDLIKAQTYLPSFVIRRSSNRSGNLPNSTSFVGIYRSNRTAYLVFNITDGVEAIHLNNELRIFNSLVQQANISHLAVIFMGKTLDAIYDEVFKKIAHQHRLKRLHFSEVYQKIVYPIHFIPANDFGVQGLKYMQIPNYREVIARAALGSSYRMPYHDMPDTDTIHIEKPHYPAVVAVDTDIKRIDKALAAAKAQGYHKICIYALKEQVHLFQRRYGNDVDILELPKDQLKIKVPHTLEPYEPDNKPFITKEGRYVDVADITMDRKIRTQSRT